MKRTKTMRVAVLLLTLALITSCFVGGTFAKYVTSASAAGSSARVAKFGVTATAAENVGLFNKEYASNTTGFTGATVKANTEVVAPGTSGSFTKDTVTISGTPEVAVEVALKVSSVTVTGWMVDDAFYCPIKVTVGGTTVSGLTKTSAEDFGAAIKSAIDAGAKATFAPGTNLSTAEATGVGITWAWDFEGAASSNQTDEKDTKLGDLIVGTDYTANITLEGLAVSVTQID